MKDHVILTNGLAFDSDRFGEEGTPLVRIRDLKSGVPSTRFDGDVPQEAVVEQGDVLVGMDGDFEVVRWPGEQAALNQRVCRLRAHPTMDEGYLFYLLPLPLTFINDTIYFTTVKHLSSIDLLGERIPLPSLERQQKIAEFLDRETARIDGIVESKGVLAERLKERLNALVSRAFEDNESSGVRLKHVLSQPLKYGANEPGAHEERGWPRFIRTTDVTDDGELRDDTFKSLPPKVARGYMLENGDLLLTRSGATVGKAMRYQGGWGRACFAGYMIRARPDRRKVVPRYLEHFTRSASYWQQVDLAIWQATIQNISAERYGNFVLPLPSVSKQERIVRHLDEETRRTKELIGSLASQMELLRERRQALITAAVTGELDVARAS